MELINGNSEPVKEFFQSLECLLDGINRLAKENKPSFGGDSFLSNREVSKLLKVRAAHCRNGEIRVLFLTFRYGERLSTAKAI